MRLSEHAADSIHRFFLQCPLNRLSREQRLCFARRSTGGVREAWRQAAAGRVMMGVHQGKAPPDILAEGRNDVLVARRAAAHRSRIGTMTRRPAAPGGSAELRPAAKRSAA
jgi:hypothetical protein